MDLSPSHVTLSEGVVDIIRHPGAIGERCAVEVSTGSELFVGDVRSFEVDSSEVGSFEPSFKEIRFLEIGFNKVGFNKIGIKEDGSKEDGSS